MADEASGVERSSVQAVHLGCKRSSRHKHAGKSPNNLCCHLLYTILANCFGHTTQRWGTVAMQRTATTCSTVYASYSTRFTTRSRSDAPPVAWSTIIPYSDWLVDPMPVALETPAFSSRKLRDYYEHRSFVNTLNAVQG